MSLPAPTIVVFDMDGTSVRHLNPKMLTFLEELDNTLNRIQSLFSWVFCRGGQGNPMLDWEAYEAKKKPRLLAHKAMHKLRRKDVDQIVEPCPGIYGVLDYLRSKRIPMALVSNGLGKGYGHDVLGCFDMEKYFHAKVFREDIVKSKPAPDGILLAIRQMGVEIRDDDVIWYIGDRRKDIKAALAARAHLPCKLVPIAYALSAAVEAVKQGLPSYHVITSYEDMEVKLVKLSGPEHTRRAL